jgi:hypothetical protein
MDYESEAMMLFNVGVMDRAVRITVGLLLLAFAAELFFPNTGWNWLGWIGLVPLVTAVIGICPAYFLFGASTAKS